jgi:hypothetical protein
MWGSRSNAYDVALRMKMAYDGRAAKAYRYVGRRE